MISVYFLDKVFEKPFPLLGHGKEQLETAALKTEHEALACLSRKLQSVAVSGPYQQYLPQESPPTALGVA